MGKDLLSKVVFVIPLDLRHRQETFDELRAAAVLRVFGGVFVFHNVPPFQLSGTIHWGKPSRQVTEKLQSPADQSRSNLPAFVGSCAKSGQHFTHKPSMVPLLLFDRSDAVTLIRNRWLPGLDLMG